MSRKAGVFGLDHVQLAIPVGGEEAARAFYLGILGFTEVEKPESLRGRGGLWMRSGSCELHLGVEAGFRPSRKAHPGLIVHRLDDLARGLSDAGHEPRQDTPIDGRRRLFVDDPFGNRLELIELS